MLTEILIKPFIEDLERRGIEDTDSHVEGFQAGITALSSLLSEHIDNKAQLFVYLGMAISESMQWVESQAMEENDVAPIFEKEKDFGVKVTYPSNAGNEIVSTEVYTLEEFNNKFKP